MNLGITPNNLSASNTQKSKNPSFSATLIKTGSFDDVAANIFAGRIDGLETKAKSLCGKFDTFTLYREWVDAIGKVRNIIKYQPGPGTSGMQEKTGYIFGKEALFGELKGIDEINRFMTETHDEFIKHNPVN